MTDKVNLPSDFRDRLVQVADSPRLRDRVDAHGNLEVVHGRGRPSLWFTCHTDHPGLESNGDGTARIVGGMRAASLVGSGWPYWSAEG